MLWRTRTTIAGIERNVEATAEQIGEGFFELRVVAGGQLVLTEVFQDPIAMLDRAETLRGSLRARSR